VKSWLLNKEKTDFKFTPQAFRKVVLSLWRLGIAPKKIFKMSIWTNKQILTTRIAQADIDKPILLADVCENFKQVLFRFNNGFYWAAERKYGLGIEFPLKDTHNVKVYKTLDNAKKSFLKFINN
jgi:hypothetical protein